MQFHSQYTTAIIIKLLLLYNNNNNNNNNYQTSYEIVNFLNTENYGIGWGGAYDSGEMFLK